MKLFFVFQIKKYNTYAVLYMTETIKEEWNIYSVFPSVDCPELR